MAGIRPVDTWKYTAASPTPIRLGPWSVTPCRLAPWQDTQEVSNSCLPVRNSAELFSSATATWGEGVSTAASPPATVSAISSSRPPDNRRRKRRRAIGVRRLADRVNPSFFNRSLLSNEIDHGEQRDPH